MVPSKDPQDFPTKLVSVLSTTAVLAHLKRTLQQVDQNSAQPMLFHELI